MNPPSPDDLEKLLRSARVPERSEGYWENFPGRVLRRLETGEHPSGAPRGMPVAWGFSLAALCLLLGFAIGSWNRGPTPAPVAPSRLAQNQKLFHEMAALFPNQLRAIVSDEQGVRLILASQQETPSSAPLLLRVCDGARCWDVVTYSGQTVQLNGRSYEALLDADGNLMVIGPALYWHSRNARATTGNFRVEARRLDDTI